MTNNPTPNTIKRIEKIRKKESGFTLNMGCNYNPPGNTTRTNLYRKGWNDAVNKALQIIKDEQYSEDCEACEYRKRNNMVKHGGEHHGI